MAYPYSCCSYCEYKRCCTHQFYCICGRLHSWTGCWPDRDCFCVPLAEQHSVCCIGCLRCEAFAFRVGCLQVWLCVLLHSVSERIIKSIVSAIIAMTLKCFAGANHTLGVLGPNWTDRRSLWYHMNSILWETYTYISICSSKADHHNMTDWYVFT